MTIKRIDSYSRPSSEDLWLEEFSKVVKSSDIDYLKDYFKSNQKFSSVQEKMDDIKSRIGFSLHGSYSMTSELEKAASFEHSAENLKKMANILKYIKDMLTSNPGMSWGQVLNACRGDEMLGFSLLPVNLEALRVYAEFLINKTDSDEPAVNYCKSEPTTGYDKLDDMAAYYSHSITDG